MKQLIQNYKTGELRIEDVPAPLLTSGKILVRTNFSAVSPGTERTKVDQARMNIWQKAAARPDQVKNVLENVKREGVWSTYKKLMNQLEAWSPLGYSSSGTVMN